MGNLFRASPVHNQIWLINECLNNIFLMFVSLRPVRCINFTKFSHNARNFSCAISNNRIGRKCLEDNDQGKMSRMGKTNKKKKKKMKSHLTLIKTHHRMQSDENKSTSTIDLTSECADEMKNCDLITLLQRNQTAFSVRISSVTLARDQS